jgi:hypothetical protein
MSKITSTEAVARVPDLLAIVREVVQAARKNSPGGVKITPAEWLAIGEEMGLLVVAVATDAVD